MANKKRMYKKGSFPGMEPNKELTFGGMKYEDGGEYPVYKKSSDKAKSFREAFAAARKAGNMTFEWDGRKYGTRRADENKEQHAAAMKKVSGSSSETTPTTPTAGTTPPGSTRNETPAQTTRTGGSGTGANEREEALRAEIDSAKPKPAQKTSNASAMLSSSEFQSAKEAAKSPNSAATVAKFFGAKSPEDGAAKRNKRDAASVKAESKKVASSKRSSLADRRVAKKEAKASKKVVSVKSAAQKITDKVNRQAPRKDRKIERAAAKNERRLDRTAARYDRKIDPNTGISKREMNKGARKAKRADVKAASKNASAAAAASERAMGDAVERDLKSKGIMRMFGGYRKK